MISQRDKGESGRERTSGDRKRELDVHFKTCVRASHAVGIFVESQNGSSPQKRELHVTRNVQSGKLGREVFGVCGLGPGLSLA